GGVGAAGAGVSNGKMEPSNGYGHHGNGYHNGVGGVNGYHNGVGGVNGYHNGAGGVSGVNGEYANPTVPRRAVGGTTHAHGDQMV
ncbi:hypothetical protein M441DRAFT_57290, partial [Trichoderma asperellum CBS 433.97]